MLAACVVTTATATLAKPSNTIPLEKVIPVYTEAKQNILITTDNPQFIIQLKSNPTTGFSWFLREYDANLITPIKHHFIAAKTGLMGAPGYEVWTFNVKPAAFIVPQQTTIHFVYARPWQGADNSTQTIFHVTTQDK